MWQVGMGWVLNYVNPGFFFVYFNTKSCILVHSKMGSENGLYQCLSRPLCIGENEDCCKKLPNEARRAENRGRRPIAGWGSWEGAASPTS